MKKEDKEALMNVVLKGTLKEVQYAFKKHKLVVNKSFFDYELLKMALGRKHCTITNFLMKKNCRVRNPNKNNSEDETAFQLAIKFDKEGIVKTMLDRGASIYDKNHKGELPIYAAFQEGYYAAVDEILDYCCNLKNLNPEDEGDIIHFHIACIRNNLIAAEVYVTSGFDINSSLCVDAGKYFPHRSIYPGMTPLYVAVIVGFGELDSTRLVHLLLQNGADCNKADENGCTPLHLAFYYLNDDQKYIFDMLISKEQWGSTNFTNDDGLSYFHIACTTSNVNQVKKFLDTGVNIDSPVTSGMYSGYTALHIAVLHNQKKVVKLLLKRCAQVNIKTSEMKVTPLHLACEYNYVKFHQTNLESNWEPYSNPIDIDWTLNRKNQLNIIKLLLLYGADVEAKDSLGKTPLFHAGTFYFPYRSTIFQYVDVCILIRKIIEILLDNNANLNTLTNNQSSLLHIFSENRFLEIVEELMQLFVDKGLNVNAVDDAGLTPLHVAAKSGNTYMVQNLIKHNANINAKSKDSTTPLHYSIHKNSREHLYSVDKSRNIVFIVERLLYHGADINIKDSRGNSPLYYLKEWDDVGWFDSDIKLFKIIYRHIQKLLALELYVSEQVRKLISNKIYQSTFNNILLPYFNKEKLRMQHIKIDSDTSLYSILKKSPHELLKYVKNIKFMKMIESESIDTDFPECGHLLEVQYKRALIRREMLESAKASFISAIGFNLPDLCWDGLSQYLSNEDLLHLIAVENMENSLKRKFDDNQNQLEPPTKLHRKE